jgi:hypothetical protein
MKAEERAIRLSIPDEKYNMPVEQLDLSVRTMNCLRRSNITTVGELIGKGTKELLKLRNFGQKSYLEIEDRLATIGLSLNPKGEQDGEMDPDFPFEMDDTLSMSDDIDDEKIDITEDELSEETESQDGESQL